MKFSPTTSEFLWMKIEGLFGLYAKNRVGKWILIVENFAHEWEFPDDCLQKSRRYFSSSLMFFTVEKCYCEIHNHSQVLSQISFISSIFIDIFVLVFIENLRNHF